MLCRKSIVLPCNQVLSTTTGRPPRVISRRVWEAHVRETGWTKPKIAKPKEEDKPWPRSMQIAGYVAAVTFTPYTIIWVVAASPTL